MITTILIGLGAIAAGMVVLAHWDEVVGWLKDFVSTLAQLFITVAKGIFHAAAVFAKIMQEGVAAIMHKLYYTENGQFMERVTTRTVPENEVPDWVKEKLSMQETNMSKEFEQKLALKL